MNALELEAYKAELAREVLNTNNQEVLDSIKDIIQRGEYMNAPCLMDISEAKQRLQNSEARFKKGEYISEELMEEFYNKL